MLKGVRIFDFKIPKVKKITAEHRVVMCKNLITWWYHYTAEILTGSYDETEPELAAEQNIKVISAVTFETFHFPIG